MFKFLFITIPTTVIKLLFLSVVLGVGFVFLLGLIECGGLCYV